MAKKRPEWAKAERALDLLEMEHLQSTGLKLKVDRFWLWLILNHMYLTEARAYAANHQEWRRWRPAVLYCWLEPDFPLFSIGASGPSLETAWRALVKKRIGMVRRELIGMNMVPEANTGLPGRFGLENE